MRSGMRLEGRIGNLDMPSWLVPTTLSVLVVLAFTGAFFFVVTRGALLVRAVMAGPRDPAAHVYPIYSNMRLIRLVDFQPIIAAILLFQYDRLVTIIANGLQRMNLRGRKVLITSCAFGNVMPRVAQAQQGVSHRALKEAVMPRAAQASFAAGAEKVQVVDIIENELLHAQRKLSQMPGTFEYLRQDATRTTLPDASVDANVVFFLLHELPHELKGEVLKEACRVLAPGGKLYLAEFHRPHLSVLRALSWTYFKVFEPLGLALWSTHDPLAQLQGMGFACERRKVFFGNFQVITATKPAA